MILKDCTNWDELVNQVIQKKQLEYDEMNTTYAPFLKRMTQLFFKNETQTISISKSVELFDIFYVDRYLGKGLPSSLNETDF